MAAWACVVLVVAEVGDAADGVVRVFGRGHVGSRILGVEEKKSREAGQLKMLRIDRWVR